MKDSTTKKDGRKNIKIILEELPGKGEFIDLNILKELCEKAEVFTSKI